MQVIVNSLMTSYDKIGTGPVLLLLHGWGDNRKSFGDIARGLAENYEVIILDLPGFGDTQPPQKPWGLDDYAGFVNDFLIKINKPKVKAILGHSNGGAIALRGLGTGRLKAEKLVLLAAAGIRNVDLGRKRLLRIAAKTAKAAVMPLPETLRQKLKRKAYKAIGSDIFVAEHMRETFKKIVTDDTLDDAAQLNMPCLIIYGSVDTATPPSFGKLYEKAIADSRLRIIDGADHFLFKSHPQEIRRLVEEFLS